MMDDLPTEEEDISNKRNIALQKDVENVLDRKRKQQENFFKGSGNKRDI